MSQALDSLGRHYKLGVITNGNSSLAQTGVEDLFACNVIAGDHGWTKPDPRLFHAACEQLNCEAHEVVHVGDSLPEDVAGAMAAGMSAIWFNPVGLSCTPGVVPDAEVHSFSELASLFPDSSSPERLAPGLGGSAGR